MRDGLHDLSVADVIGPSSVTRMRAPAAGAGRRPRATIGGAPVLAGLDSLAAVAAIVGVLIHVTLPTLTSTLERFFEARITVKNLLLIVFFATAWPLMFRAFGLYDAERIRQVESEVRRLALATAAGALLALVFPLTSASGSLRYAHLGQFCIAAFALSFTVRLGWRIGAWARHRDVRRTLIVGTGPLAERVYRDIRTDARRQYEIVGFLDHPGNDRPAVARPRVGTVDELEQILMREVIDEVVIALPVKSYYQQIQHAIAVCERAGVEARYGAELFESTVAFPRYAAQGEHAFVAMQVAPDGYRLVVKRAIDLVGASLALIVFSPVLLLAALAVKLTSPGPVIYVQNRCGYNKRPVRMYKFRSMLVGADQLQSQLESCNEAHGPVFKIRHDPRVTRVGRWLRRSSIDELPQLWNVLRGDMSLVGPRPLPWRDVHRITRPSDMRRFSMRPGLTCLWQVGGRSNLDFERWVALDLAYIDTWSLWLDVKILLRTIPAVVSGNGAT